MNNIEKYIELKAKEKEIKNELKLLQPVVLEELKDNEIHNWYRISKALKIGFKLKSWIDESKILEKFPEVTELKINIKELSKTQWAKSYLDVEEKSYLIVKEVK